jgi:hypothetical protein
LPVGQQLVGLLGLVVVPLLFGPLLGGLLLGG